MIYLDNSATTKPSDASLNAMREALSECWGNPGSVHRAGDAANALRQKARRSAEAEFPAKARGNLAAYLVRVAGISLDSKLQNVVCLSDVGDDDIRIAADIAQHLARALNSPELCAVIEIKGNGNALFLGAPAGVKADPGQLLAQRRGDPGEMKPFRTVKYPVPVKIFGSGFGDRRTGAVIDTYAAAQVGAFFIIIYSHTVAAANDILCIDSVSAQ